MTGGIFRPDPRARVGLGSTLRFQARENSGGGARSIRIFAGRLADRRGAGKLAMK